MLILTLLAATGVTVPDEPLAGRLRAAIWDDLQRYAMIGSGNVLAASMVRGGTGRTPCASPPH
ncbi:hypothetical protein [Sphingomonas panni]|uniref:hypothetical protein n=1 Tax=Sphingomonas panni TaxID=237612 RepID=UPI001F5B5443|nr:hypothetical protein [Sphingomonas panni]